jgi:WD40 repeat protein
MAAKAGDPGSSNYRLCLCVPPNEEFTGYANSLACDPSSEFIASAGLDKFIRIWHVATGRYLKRLGGHERGVTCVTYSPRGYLASGSWDTTVRIWNPLSGECLRTLKGHADVVRAVVFALSGKVLASGGHLEAIRIWNPKTGDCTMMLAKEDVTNLSSSGESLIALCADRVIRVWNLNTSKCELYSEGKEEDVTSIACSPRSSPLERTMVVGTAFGNIKVYRMKTVEQTKQLGSHDRAVNCLAYGPLGDRLVSGSSDRTVRVWDLISGRCTYVLSHPYEIGDVVYKPGEGEVAISLSRDGGTIRVWDFEKETTFSINRKKPLRDSSNPPSVP